MYRETMLHKHPQLKFVVFPQATHYYSTQHYVYKYPLLSFLNHMSINPNFFVALVHVSSLRLDRLTHVEQTITQTNHVLTPLLFCLSPRYQLSDIAISALTVLSKIGKVFCFRKVFNFLESRHLIFEKNQEKYCFQKT